MRGFVNFSLLLGCLGLSVGKDDGRGGALFTSGDGAAIDIDDMVFIAMPLGLGGGADRPPSFIEDGLSDGAACTLPLSRGCGLLVILLVIGAGLVRSFGILIPKLGGLTV